MKVILDFINQNVWYAVLVIAVIAIVIFVIVLLKFRKKSKKDAAEKLFVKEKQEEPRVNVKKVVLKQDPIKVVEAKQNDEDDEDVKIQPKYKITIPEESEDTDLTPEEAFQKAKKSGKIEIYLDNAGKFRFRIFASNASIVGHSQGYTTKSSCKNGIKAVQAMKNVDIFDMTKDETKPLIGVARCEVYKDNEGKFRFRFRASNTSIVLAGQGYTTKDNCFKGINSVKNFSFDSELLDSTKK